MAMRARNRGGSLDFSLSPLLRIVGINFCLLLIGVLLAELFFRLRSQWKIDLASPRHTLVSFGSALQNHGGRWWEDHLNHSDNLRMPYPYLMFKGKPGYNDHDLNGFRIQSSTSDTNAITIAFFGGSTGYMGSPPISDLLAQVIWPVRNVRTLNFSVVSSNHNQHLHSLVQNHGKYSFDLVVFYGGYNETLQTAFYDSRPGFPYNFNKRHEIGPSLAILYRHSALFNFIADRFHKSLLEPEHTPFHQAWNSAIVKNYISAIAKADRLSSALTTGRCLEPFVFVYQPFQKDQSVFVPSIFEQEVNRPIQIFASRSKSGIDLSSTFEQDKSVYADIVHLKQRGNQQIATLIAQSPQFLRAIRSCE